MAPPGKKTIWADFCRPSAATAEWSDGEVAGEDGVLEVQGGATGVEPGAVFEFSPPRRAGAGAGGGGGKIFGCLRCTLGNVIIVLAQFACRTGVPSLSLLSRMCDSRTAISEQSLSLLTTQTRLLFFDRTRSWNAPPYYVTKGVFCPRTADQDPREPRGRIISCFQDALLELECMLFTTVWTAPENPSRRLLGRITGRLMAARCIIISTTQLLRC